MKLTFLQILIILVLASSFFAQKNSPKSSNIVNYCELLDSTMYDEKTIRTSAVIYSSAESENCTIEDGWNGIKLFQTNREQVEKLVGKPVATDDGTVSYETADALVNIIYSNTPCQEGNRLRNKFNVPQSTVIWYLVVLKKTVKFSSFEWQKNLYSKSQDIHSFGVVYYINQKNGVVITTGLSDEGFEQVRTIRFEPTRKMSLMNNCKGKKKIFKSVQFKDKPTAKETIKRTS
jgi:hypothetical protein